MSVTNTYICEVMDVLTGWEESFHSGHVYQIINDILQFYLSIIAPRKLEKMLTKERKGNSSPFCE